MNLIFEIFSSIGRFFINNLEYIDFFELFRKKDEDDHEETVDVYDNLKLKKANDLNK